MAARVTDARVVVTCPGRNFVTLRLETSDGLSGLGDATLNGRELAVASYLEQHVIPQAAIDNVPAGARIVGDHRMNRPRCGLLRGEAR